MERVPYIKDELKVLGHYPSFDPALPGGNIYNTPVSPRENTLAFLHGKKPLWTPMSIDGVTMIPRHVPDNVARALVFDAQPLKPEERIGGPDMFGVEWVYVPTVSGSMVRPGNPTLKDVNEWPNYIKEPDISAWGWEEAAVRNAAFIGTGRAMTAWIMTGLFERLISFMDFEPAALALIDEDQQDALHGLFDFLCSVYEKQIDRYQTYFGADIIYFHDDWGAQRSPFFSLDVCRDMLVPHLRRLSDYCHSKGMFLNLHSCGAVGKLIPAMIDAHVDIWSGQDYNDKKNLLDMYGDKITIEIGPPPPLSAAPGSKQPTPDEIAAAAEKWMDIYGKSGKRAFASTRMAPDSYGESIYEQSRILLNRNFD